MCTWTAASVNGHFNRAGNDVFGALLDCTKSFDMVEWLTLFHDLIRVLLYIYREQSCDLSWNDKFSSRFGVKNGVRQGAVSSPILFVMRMMKF